MNKSESEGTCANCGKEGSDVTNTCNKCKMVMYCNASCKKKHRSKHKKHCERIVAELHDEKLFKQPPPQEDCPICMIRLPTVETETTYMACCGKSICNGCIYAVQVRAIKAGRREDDVCPFCRSPPPSSDGDLLKRFEKRIDLNDARALHNLGVKYYEGTNGLPQNLAKALELWHRAAELGFASSYSSIGNFYDIGHGIERNTKKATHYWELAAMAGHLHARHNLGVIEARAGNMDKALKHFMIAVKDGGVKDANADSLENIKQFYMEGHATKEDYTNALRSYQAYVDEIKSDQRDKAAAFKKY